MQTRPPHVIGRIALFVFCAHCGPGQPDAVRPLDAINDTSQDAALGLAGPCWVDDVKVRDFGHVVFTGSVDLTAEVRRIAHGEHLPFRHDGTVFGNREHRLPERPRAYYHEYVHPTPKIRGPGPQRLVIGDDGDVNYTPDHYASFVSLDSACTIKPEANKKRVAPQTGLEPVTR